MTNVSHGRDDAAGRLPLVALLLSVVALAVHGAGPLPALLAVERAAVAAGQWWRLVTGHWTHWSFDHLVWDLLVFAVLGAWCERQSRVRFVACLLGSALLISAAVWWLEPSLASYRGLSGLDSALFALVAVTRVRAAAAERAFGLIGLAAGLLMLFAAKLAFELATGACLFVDTANSGFTPVPLAHAVGGGVGVVCGLVPERTRSCHHPGQPQVELRAS